MNKVILLVEDILQSYTLGANAHLRKPVDFADFTRAATTLGLSLLLLNEAASPPGGAS